VDSLLEPVKEGLRLLEVMVVKPMRMEQVKDLRRQVPTGNNRLDKALVVVLSVITLVQVKLKALAQEQQATETVVHLPKLEVVQSLKVMEMLLLLPLVEAKHKLDKTRLQLKVKAKVQQTQENHKHKVQV
jgi:hypothetical protein